MMKNKEFETLYCTLCEYRDLGRGECPCIECIHGFGKNDMFEEAKNLENIVLPPNTEAVFQHKSVPEIKDSGERRVFESGAVRDCAEGKGRMDLLPWNAVLEVSKHCERGAAKYGEHNVDLGLPLHSFVDSGFRHLAKFAAGYVDEAHLTAAAWNLLWALEFSITRPDLVDVPWKKEDKHD